MSHLALNTIHQTRLDEPAALTTSTAYPAIASGPATASTDAPSPANVAISFAFDRAHKTLRVVMTNERSGEIVRKMEYTQIPHETHRSDKLNGLLLNQLA